MYFECLKSPSVDVTELSFQLLQIPSVGYTDVVSVRFVNDVGVPDRRNWAGALTGHLNELG